MTKRRDRQQDLRIESVYPGEIYDGIGFTITITKTQAGVLRHKSVSSDRCILDVVRIGIIRNLVVISAQRSHQPQLVRGIHIEDQRPEASIAIFRIVDHLRNRRLNAEIAAISIHAAVISKTLGVAAKIELVVGLIEVARA